MNSYTQLFIIIISFIYGIGFYLLAKYNQWITKNLSTFLKYIVTFIFILDVVIIYIYIIYQINSGIFHIYFLLSMLLGYIMIGYFYQNIVKLCQKIKNKKK